MKNFRNNKKKKKLMVGRCNHTAAKSQADIFHLNGYYIINNKNTKSALKDEKNRLATQKQVKSDSTLNLINWLCNSLAQSSSSLVVQFLILLLCFPVRLISVSLSFNMDFNNSTGTAIISDNFFIRIPLTYKIYLLYHIFVMLKY